MKRKLSIKERNRRISEGLRLAWQRRKADKNIPEQKQTREAK